MLRKRRIGRFRHRPTVTGITSSLNIDLFQSFPLVHGHSTKYFRQFSNRISPYLTPLEKLDLIRPGPPRPSVVIHLLHTPEIAYESQRSAYSYHSLSAVLSKLENWIRVCYDCVDYMYLRIPFQFPPYKLPYVTLPCARQLCDRRHNLAVGSAYTSTHLEVLLSSMRSHPSTIYD